jgi:hypothetical protein
MVTNIDEGEGMNKIPKRAVFGVHWLISAGFAAS